MMPQEEIKARMQLDSLLFTFNQLSEETGSVENCCKHLIVSTVFWSKERVARQTGRVEKKWEGAGLQDPTPVLATSRWYWLKVVRRSYSTHQVEGWRYAGPMRLVKYKRGCKQGING